jgi:hypothetical protein
VSTEPAAAHIRGLRQKVLALVNSSDPSAVRKSEHYLHLLDAQLIECDKTEQAIDMLMSPFPARTRNPSRSEK